jgi:hypothetical protein
MITIHQLPITSYHFNILPAAAKIAIVSPGTRGWRHREAESLP